MRGDTRVEIITAGSELIARSGYGQTGLDKILKKAGVPKGSFYYYFDSKEAFGLAVIDHFASHMLEAVRKRLHDSALPPLERLRGFLNSGVERLESNECKRGCLLGDLGQELAHQNEAFRKRIEAVFAEWTGEIAACLDEARASGQLPSSLNTQQVAEFVLSGWEGAILRAKVSGSVAPRSSSAASWPMFEECGRPRLQSLSPLPRAGSAHQTQMARPIWSAALPRARVHPEMTPSTTRKT
jgi:TetR/AcrR family transcriptional repressor of nem operon